MKKLYYISIALMLLCIQAKAQKFLDIYQNGNITTSVSPSNLDSISVTGDTPENRRVNFYRDGKTVNSFLASEVDSIKVFRSDEEPLVYLGIVGFNQELYEKPIDVLASNNYSVYTNFVNSLPSKDGTLLYYAVDHALDMLEAYNFDTQINSVNLITFTDGLDQGSLMINSNYSTEVQYLNAVSNRIKNLNVKGMPLTAYSIGLRGNDVTDYTMFQNNLNKLASSSDKAFEANNMSEVNSRLQSISDQLISISNKQNVSVKIPGLSNGTVIRFTFDGSSAENSTLYIQGTFNLASRSLTDITYHGIKSTSGNIVQGTQDGIFVTFTFSGLQREDGNGLIPMNYIQEYYKSASTSEWQRNSEFSPANNTLTTVTHSGSVIMLVLDCSSSLGSQFGDMKSYSRDFISRVAGNTAPYSVDTPTAVTAVIPDDDFIIRVSWNAVKHAESYDVYRSNSSSYGFTKVASEITATTWNDNTPLSGNNYYRVCAVGHGLTSSASNTTYVNYSLDAPQNATATIQENNYTINVAWDAVAHAESYDVYRSSNSSGGFIKVASGIASTTWNDATPLAGNNYYRIYAIGHGLTSPASNTTSVINYALDAPQNVTAVIPDDDFVIRVSWDAVAHAESYDVYRSSNSSYSFTKVAEGVTAATWDDATPPAGNNYYRVCAVGHGLTSPSSNTIYVSYTLDAPQNVTASINDDDFTIIVSWDAVPHAKIYDIYRSSDDNNFTKVAEGVANTYWKDEAPFAGNNYYKVYAISNGITSPASNTTTVINYALDAPKNVTAEIPDDDFVIRVSWDAVVHAESYDVYRSSNSSSGFTKVAEGVTATVWNDATPLVGNSYYRIYAVGHGLTSPASNTTTVINYALDAPKNVTAEIPDDDFVIRVSWDAVVHAESYDVYRSSNSSSGFTKVAESVTATVWNDATPLVGNNYYRIYAVGHGLTSPASNTTTVINYALDAPKNVTAEIPDDDFVIRVSWDAVVHAESYDVYRSSNSSSGFTKVAEGVTATVWNDATPLAGNNYYRIYAVGHGLTSPVSNTTTVINYVLDAPTNVAATYDGNTKTITVSWNSVPHAVNYDVYRNGILLAENVAGTSCVDNSLGLGPTTYYVKAKNHGVVSEASESTYIFIHANDEAIEVTVNGVDIYMVKVTGGTFQMGATAEQGTVEWRDYYGNERPVHQVTLSDYYIGETEVTQELWQAVMGSNPSYFKTSNQLPVECVSWNDCQTFITNLNQLTGKQFRLPTEAEWEYAARSGNMSQGYKYSGSNDIGEVAWWAGNSDDKTHAVGTMSPNELGIFDMSGNVLEFCQDWYGSYSSSEQTNPTGPSSGSQRVKRGGCWMNLEVGCRVSYRDVIESDNGNFTLGLRLAL